MATDFILGIGKGERKFIIILEMDKIFSTDEESYLNKFENSAELTEVRP